MGSGCEDAIVEKFLRPPGNSPSRWHLTRGFLLCSDDNIQHFTENVKSETDKKISNKITGRLDKIGIAKIKQMCYHIS